MKKIMVVDDERDIALAVELNLKSFDENYFIIYAESGEKCLELGYEFPEITGWIRAVINDFALVKQFKLKETGILTSASDYHIYLKLKLDRKKALEK